ncbi:hypothetical protein TNCV_4560141 [Trichonephila clavipes]|nr:hypothetical protein TNCV_4560141 [Trichonephila clavipes]
MGIRNQWVTEGQTVRFAESSRPLMTNARANRHIVRSPHHGSISQETGMFAALPVSTHTANAGSACSILMAVFMSGGSEKTLIVSLHSISAWCPGTWCDGLCSYWIHDTHFSSSDRR